MIDPRPASTRVNWLELWILLSAWCALSGWGLSVIGCLNAGGIVVSFALFFLALFLLWKPLELSEAARGRGWHLVRSRRLLPRVWLALTVLALIGGLAYVPNNYDYLSYRFPRVLYWCWEQKWFWITTANARMNYSGTLFEWMMVPTFILFKTDRLFFLINFVAFLFLPGLVFSVFRGLGISARISWWWMWVLPCGYCYILQAGSVGNDSFALVYLLASLHFLLRARTSASAKNLVFSTLAIALMTGAKVSNAPLALPWAILLFFTRDRAFLKVTPALMAALIVVATAVSFVPQAVLNRIHTGDFFGDPANNSHLRVDDPLGGILGNGLTIGLENLAPPLWYKELSVNIDLPEAMIDRMQRAAPRFGTTFDAREFPVEEGAGVGIGCVAGLALFLLVSGFARAGGRSMVAEWNLQGLWIAAGVAIAALVYMAKIGSEAAPRLVAPYYTLVVASGLIVAALDGRVVCWRLFRVAGLLVMLSAVPALILSPSRPMFPVQAVGAFLGRHGSAAIQQRFQAVYPLYAERAFTFEQALALIPPSETRIGFLQNSNALEASLWRPFGAHRVVEFFSTNTADEIKASGVRWVIVSDDALVMHAGTNLDAMLAKWSAHLVGTKHFAMTAHQGSETWYVVELDGP
jgi:hypothetical protein